LAYTGLLIDVVQGRGSGFSLEAPEGIRFLNSAYCRSNERAGGTGRAQARAAGLNLISSGNNFAKAVFLAGQSLIISSQARKRRPPAQQAVKYRQ
jgi:hypothetical protein